MSVPAAAEIVLGFWFDETPAEARFGSDPDFDARLRARFGTLHAALGAGVPATWTTAARPLLAGVIALDQFSRNLFRGAAAAFAHDATARDLAATALARGDDALLTTTERQFLYMPLMHSEAPADQTHAVALFEALGDPDATDFARRHRDVIARFGRFPGRNAALGRTSTAAEAAFLAEGGAGF